MAQKITPFLWFDKEALEAAKLYTSIFNSAPGSSKNSKINNEENYKDTPSGEIQIVTIVLDGQEFMLMNAGPTFKFSEAISFIIDCKDQQEVDYFWNKLTSDGGEESQCGWLKDKFGVSWQVIPKQLNELLAKDKSGKVMQAMLKMKKIIVADLEKAYSG